MWVLILYHLKKTKIKEQINFLFHILNKTKISLFKNNVFIIIK